jgi:hypothetical protein
VAGHVYKADTVAAGEREMCEPEIDRNAARLLFGQPIGIHPRQGADERSLPVVDMAGRTHDNSAHITI